MSDRLNSTERVGIERYLIGSPLVLHEIYAEAERMRAEHGARLVRQAVAWIKGRVGRLTASMKNARIAKELAALDDRQLADIGLHRSDIAAIAAGKDPRDATRPTAEPAAPAAPANDGGKIAA